MHPCSDNIAHAPYTWVAADGFKRNTKKRFRGCKECNEYCAKYQAKRKSAWRNTKAACEAKEILFRSKPKTVVAKLCYVTVEELENEEAVARKRAATELASAKLKYPGCLFSINVFGASTGTIGFSVQEEGRANLTTRGTGDPAIVVPLPGAASSSADR